MRRHRGAPGARRDGANLARAGAAARALGRRLAGRHVPPGRWAGRSRRWALWARSLAGRFGTAGRAAGRPAPTFRRWARCRALRLVERIVERVRVGAAPPLLLSLEPRLALAWRDGARPVALQAVRPLLAAGGLRAPAFVGRASASSPPAPPGRTAPPLERARARTSRAVWASPVERLPAPARKRLEAPVVASADRAPQKRLFARTRHESLPGRPAARTLHRPPKHTVETPIEAPAVGRRRPAGPDAPGTATSVPLPGRDLDRLTEQVVQRIDRRMTAWRERTGRTR